MSPHNKPAENFDFYVPLLSLPGIFKTTLETIPAQVPYLSATSEKVEYWRGRLPESGLKVGIVWAGKSMHHGVRKRSCSLKNFAWLADIPGVRLIGLQKGAAASQIKRMPTGTNITNLGGYFRNFTDTAGVIENLDLVITVDTSVAHLAGAMGKPVWTLLSFSPDWRWLLDREDSPWYPTMRLFRQPEPGDWDAVFQSVAENLQILAQKRHPLEDRYGTGNKYNITQRSSSDIEAELKQAIQFHQSGQLDKAQKIYEQIIEIDPAHSDALHLLGFIAHQMGRNNQAEDLITKAIRILPGYPFYYNSLGLVFKEKGKLKEAMTCYSKALELKPDLTEAHNNMGIALQYQGKLDEALACFKRALTSNPNAAEAYNNMANILRDQGKLDEAITSYQKALELRPDYPEAYNNLGVSFQSQNRFTEAVSNYQKAIALRPGYTEAYINTGIAYQANGWLDEAISCYQKAIELEPDNADSHFHRAFVLLLNGNFQDGWKEYEWRLLKDEWKNTHIYDSNIPLWDGSSFKSKTLFVHSEQGLGDTLQFVRYLPLIKSLGGEVIFETAESLVSLFQNLPGIDKLVPLSSERPASDYDYYTPLLSVPGLLATSWDTIPAEVPYICSDPKKSAYWAGRLPKEGFKVGLVWAGKPAADDNRPCKLKHFFPLSRIPGVHLLGLQKGEAAGQTRELPDGMIINNLGEEFLDFADTAGTIANLDLIISIDTSVAHLAGAMGKKVWTLVPFAPDWRWLLGREDSPWYPTMRLFRQPKPGNWAAVLERVAEKLQGLA